jgi:hypothetical protein
MSDKKPKGGQPAEEKVNQTKDPVTLVSVKKTNKKKPLLIVVFIVVIVLFASAIAIYTDKDKNESPQVVYACKDDVALIEEFKTASKNDNIDELQKVADKVRAKQGFESDPNCLFIITENDINRAAYDDAKSNLDKLKASNTASPGVLITDIYRGRAVDFTVLEDRIEYSKKLREQAIENGMINQFKRPE